MPQTRDFDVDQISVFIDGERVTDLDWRESIRTDDGDRESAPDDE